MTNNNVKKILFGKEKIIFILLLIPMMTYTLFIGTALLSKLVMQLVGNNIALFEFPIAIGYLFYFFIAMLFFNSTIKLVLTSLVIVCGSIYFMYKYKINKKVVIISLLNICALIGFFFMNNNYQTEFKAQPGYTMKWVTKPNPIEAVAKSVMASMELKGCTYKLYGWDEKNTLFYTSECSSTKTMYSFAFDTDTKGKKIDTPPQNLKKGACDRTISSRTLQREYSLGEEGSTKLTRTIEKMPELKEGKWLFYNGFSFSPDCKYLAVVESHFYGPQDIIVVSTQK